MCGILGFSGSNQPRKRLQQLQLIQHRGYDESVHFYVAGINLGMNRLAIQDLTKGYYPFHYQDFILIFNGEIYNYPNLKQKLEKQGITFRTNCDAEVILPLFAKYGTKAFKILEGMFAISIVDTRQHKLYLIRDKSGEKPLYYRQHPVTKNLSFASELKCLLGTKHHNLNLNQAAGYLFHGSVNHGQTLAKGIYKVPAGHYLSFDLREKAPKLYKYWQISSRPPTFHSEKELITTLDSLLQSAVEKRLIADVEVGTFLSGGIDSSLVSYYVKQKKAKLNTFSIAFPNSGHHDESDFSYQVAEKLGTNHQVITFTSKDARKAIETLGSLIDEPIVDPAFMPTYYLAKSARKKVKVVLTGEGADEVFGGYYRYYKYLGLNRFQSLVKELTWLKIVRDRLAPTRLNSIFTDNLIYSPQSVWQPQEISTLLYRKKPAKVTGHLPPKNTLKAMQLFDYHWYLPEQLLMKVDKATMANNLESRAPFLDTEVINFGMNLPDKYKLHGIHNKYLLRLLFKKYISPTTAWRKKHGFSLPLADWFRTELQDMVYDSYEDLKVFKSHLNLEYYRSLIELHMTSQADNSNKIWSLIVLSRWIKNYRLEI